MARIIDLRGHRFGRLLAVRIQEERNNGECCFVCICDCGTELSVNSHRLRSGKTKSCGCLRREAIIARNITHNLSGTELYNMWSNVRKRCYDKKGKQYKDYGGRGINMYDLWINNPLAFVAWCRDNGWVKGLEIDRIDNDGNYVPGNIRFITHKEQQRNTRKNVYYTLNGETKCLVEWAEFVGVKYATIYSRISRGWSIYEAIFDKKIKINT